MLGTPLMGCVTLAVVLCHLLALARTQVYNIASTKYGPVRGLAVGTGPDTIYSYWGVPFAKPPTGDLRFKQPQAPDTWTATRDVLQPSHDCMQILRYGLEKLGVHLNISEDCLYLNVFTPSSGSNATLLPVMVWIHGGAFIMGSATAYDGTALARKGVVVVTLNYRLDAFGFLSTEDDVMPGNFGLLDQIFALKWVKENIASFGGDANQVTIFGESAGACSVSILTLSPLAKGLFKRAIMESGSAFSPWCLAYPKVNLTPKKTVSLIGVKVNCNFPDNSRQLFDCLQKVNAQSLLNASVEVQYELMQGTLNEVLRPRVETTFGVLPALPKTLLTSGQYDSFDAIRGFNSNEDGAMKPNYTSGATIQEFRQFVQDNLLPFDLRSKDDVINLFEAFYLTNVSDPIQILQKSSEASSDFKFVLPALFETVLASDAIPDKKQYLYEFSYRQSVSSLPPWASAAHGDELPFVFRTFLLPLWISTSQPTADDLGVSDQIITMWTNFAKTGNPTSTVPAGAAPWPRFIASYQDLLKIGKESKVFPAGRSTALGYYSDFVNEVSDKGTYVVVG